MSRSLETLGKCFLASVLEVSAFHLSPIDRPNVRQHLTHHDSSTPVHRGTASYHAFFAQAKR